MNRPTATATNGTAISSRMRTARCTTITALLEGSAMSALALPGAIAVDAVFGIRQIGLDGKQRIDELVLLGCRQAGESIAPQFRRCSAHGLDSGLDLVGQEYPLRAPVAGMAFAPHPALLLQAVKQAAERGLFHFEDVRQLRLRGAVVAEQVVQHPPLRSRQPKRLHAPVEGGAHQPGDVVQDETEIAGQVFADHGADSTPN